MKKQFNMPYTVTHSGIIIIILKNLNIKISLSALRYHILTNYVTASSCFCCKCSNEIYIFDTVHTVAVFTVI